MLKDLFPPLLVYFIRLYVSSFVCLFNHVLIFFIFVPFLDCTCILPSKLETCIEVVTVLTNDQIFVVLLTLRWKASCLETGLLLLMSLQYTNRLTYIVTVTCR